MTQPMPTWHFEKMSRAGSITGAAIMESLIGANLSVEEILAREALQNSCDATLNHLPTRIRIKQISENPELLAHIEYKEKLSKHIEHSFYQHDDLTIDQYSNHILFEDFNTCGLGGNIDVINEKSHFARLVYHNATGLTKSSNSKSVGGSFGRGKAAYPSASHICTVFYYTVYVDETDKTQSRLIGVSYSREYSDENQQRMTGRAFWGLQDINQNDFFVAPLTGDLAHDYAQKMGFTKRSEQETGTSVLILNCHINLEHLCSAIETWWWPRLSDNLLDINIYDSIQKKYTVQPKQNPTIREFIETYEALANNQVPDHINHSQISESGRHYGRLAYKVVQPTATQLEDEYEYLLNSIALIRGPRMVVEYVTPRRISNNHFGCGIFVAERESSIDDFFKRSEPPAHDKWAEKSERLSDSEKKILKSLLNNIRKKFRVFVNSHEENNSDTGNRGRELERLLGQLFGGKTGLKSLPQTTKADMFSITEKKNYIRESGLLHSQHIVSFCISLRSKSSSSQLQTGSLSVTTNISARGAGGNADLKVQYEKISIDGTNIDPNTKPILINVGTKPTKCIFVTRPISNKFQTEWQITLSTTN